ncbi:MAG: tRNA (adenosine(37)-N6)-threonylcarbamoyltransferase complex dimerization subunit type 1 TsaB [Parachlamydiaceae bacterium]
MISLILDTATERGLVALCSGEQVLLERQLPFGLQNSKTLFVELEQIFRETGIAKNELELVICGQGPGSYTGVRVAAAAAKTISFALQIPLVGVPTTMGFIPDAEGPFISLIDAKISGAYMQEGIHQAGHAFFKTAPKVISLEDLTLFLTESITIVTPKKAQLQVKIESFFAAPLNWEEKGLCAQTFLLEGMRKFQNHQVSLQQELELLYLRKTQAEIEKERISQNN